MQCFDEYMCIWHRWVSNGQEYSWDLRPLCRCVNVNVDVDQDMGPHGTLRSIRALWIVHRIARHKAAVPQSLQARMHGRGDENGM